MTLTIYDAVMAVVILGGMVWGALRGVTWQVASMASLVLGYTAARQFSPSLAPHLPGDPNISRVLAMLAIYTGVSAGVYQVAWVIRSTLEKLKFEAFDRHMGMVLGGIEGALLGLVVTFFVTSLAPSSREPIFSSPSGKLVGRTMNALGPVLPSEAREALAPFIDEAKKAVATGEKVYPDLLPEVEKAIGQATGANDDGASQRR
jgi:membrane protein required for colicin V production